uniref:Uncharacterized protein n=1 Tax=Pyricularia oryzae (strain P131) TaxID=1143193 RepID=L7J8Q3_PYRO1
MANALLLFFFLIYPLTKPPTPNLQKDKLDDAVLLV